MAYLLIPQCVYVQM